MSAIELTIGIGGLVVAIIGIAVSIYFGAAKRKRLSQSQRVGNNSTGTFVQSGKDTNIS